MSFDFGCPGDIPAEGQLLELLPDRTRRQSQLTVLEMANAL